MILTTTEVQRTLPTTTVSWQLEHSSTSTTGPIHGGPPRDSLDPAVENFGERYASQPEFLHLGAPKLSISEEVALAPRL